MKTQIIKILTKLQNWIYFWVWLSLTIWIVSLAYAAISYSSLGWQTSWNQLSSTMWNKLYEHSVPVGFVGSFDLSYCPDWWSEYIPARWRFIRWIDSTWTNDNVRVAWNTQEDAFQWHWHMSWTPNTYERTSWARWTAADNTSWERASWYGARRIISDTVNWTPRIAPETRPKNVALLFCRKN